MLSGMPITMLNGLGCPDCGGTCKPLGSVIDYDVIRIGGGNYTANQIVDKTIVANRETKLYSNASGKGTVVGVVKIGQPIGKVYSYLKPSNKSTDGRGWLMFESSYNKAFYVPNENVANTGLKEQGTLTLTEEKKVEDDAKLKDESPMEYYIKKYALKGVLIIGAIIIVGGLVKESAGKLIDKKVKPTT